MKEYFKDKNIGFYAAVATALFALIASIMYAIMVQPGFNSYIQPTDFSIPVFLCMFLAAMFGIALTIVPSVLQALNSKTGWYADLLKLLTALAPWVMFGLILFSFVRFIYSGYTIYLSLAPGREGLEPILITGIQVPLIVYLITLISSIVSVSAPVFKKVEQ